MYFWLKFLHITAMAVWFTGLFFLPRLFVAHRRGGRDARPDYFNPAANTLFFRLATPAAVIAIGLGLALIGFGPSGAWLVIKLTLVSVAVLMHVYLGVLLYELGRGRGRDRHGPGFYRTLGWLPLLLLLAIAALSGAKPQSAGDLPPPPAYPQAR